MSCTPESKLHAWRGTGLDIGPSPTGDVLVQTRCCDRCGRREVRTMRRGAWWRGERVVA